MISWCLGRRRRCAVSWRRTSAVARVGVAGTSQEGQTKPNSREKKNFSVAGAEAGTWPAGTTVQDREKNKRPPSEKGSKRPRQESPQASGIDGPLGSLATTPLVGACRLFSKDARPTVSSLDPRSQPAQTQRHLRTSRVWRLSDDRTLLSEMMTLPGSGEKRERISAIRGRKRQPAPGATRRKPAQVERLGSVERRLRRQRMR